MEHEPQSLQDAVLYFADLENRMKYDGVSLFVVFYRLRISLSKSNANSVGSSNRMLS
jgi:hypothetical protein